MEKCIRFLYKHEMKLTALGAIVYAIGMLCLPREYSIEKMWVKAFDIIVGPELFYYGYIFFIATPSLIIGGIMGHLLGLERHNIISFIGMCWCMCSVFFGILSYMYNSLYLFSSMCLFVTGVFVIIIPIIDKKGMVYENNSRSGL